MIPYSYNHPVRNNSYRRHYAFFSLIEVMVVIAIVVMLAAVCLPAYVDMKSEDRYHHWRESTGRYTVDGDAVLYLTFEKPHGHMFPNLATRPTDRDETSGGSLAYGYGVTWVDGGGRWTSKPTLSFDGQNDSIEVELTTIPQGSWTIGIWIKTSTNRAQGICGWSDGSGTGSFCLSITPANEEGGVVQAELQSEKIVGSAVVTDGRWHHIVVVYDNGKEDDSIVQLVVDGKPDVQPTRVPNFSVGPNSFTLRIGAHPTRPVHQYLNGKIDEITMFKRAMDISEIELSYEYGCP